MQVKHIGRGVRQLSNLIEQNLCKAFEEMDLTMAQSFILTYLVRQDGKVVYSRDLEQRFNMRHPTISGLLQRLELKGFVKLETEPGDRRLKRIVVQEKARSCNEDICRIIEGMEARMKQDFTPAETEQLEDLLKRAIVNLGGCTQDHCSGHCSQPLERR